MADAFPTVIVSRRVRPGSEREFERWNQRLRAAAARFPGHVGSEIQPPSAAHPDEWVVLYRFATVEALDRWLTSPERTTLMEEGASLVVAEAREQRMMEPMDRDEAVTAVMSQRARPGADAELRQFHRDVTAVMATFPGFLRCDLLDPVPGAQDDHMIVFSFASRPDLDRWLNSQERSAMLATIEPLIEGERTLNVIGGFAGWFRDGVSGPPTPWKQAVVVMVALFPTSVILRFLQLQTLPDLPWVLGVFILNVTAVAILNWFLMPLVTGWFGSWLRR